MTSQGDRKSPSCALSGAHERDGQLTIYHVVDSDLPATVVEAQRTHAENYLETEICRWLGRDKPPHRIDIGVGDPANAIAAYAQEHAVDLVVAGRHRQRMVVDTFFGTTVERLLWQIQRPILIANSPNQSAYRRILVPVDFSDASTAATQFAATFLPEARLHLLHAYKKPFQDYVAALSGSLGGEEKTKFAGPIARQAQLAMSHLIQTLGLDARNPMITIENGDAAALITEELSLQKTDLVVMGTHAPSGIEHALIGSVTESILRSTACDILVIPAYRSF